MQGTTADGSELGRTPSKEVALEKGTFAGVEIGELTLKNVHVQPRAFDGMISISDLKYEGTEFPPLDAKELSGIKNLN